MQAVETLRVPHSTKMDQDDRAGSVLMGGIDPSKITHDSFLNLQATPPTTYHYKRRTESGSATPPNLYDGVFLAGTESQTKRQPTVGRGRPLPVPMQTGSQSGVAVIVGLTEKASIQDSANHSNGAAPTTEHMFTSSGPKRPLPQPNGLQTARPAFPLFSHRRANSSSSARSLSSSQPSIVTQLSVNSGSSHASSPSSTSLSFSGSTTDVNSRTQKPSLIGNAVEATRAVHRAQAKGQGGSGELISLGDALLHSTVNQNQNQTHLIASARSSSATDTSTLCQDDGPLFETSDPFKRMDIMSVAAITVGLERDRAERFVKEKEKEKDRSKDTANYLLTKTTKAATYGDNRRAEENGIRADVTKPYPSHNTPPPMLPIFNFQSTNDASASRGSGLFPGGITIGGEHMRFSNFPMPKGPPPPSSLPFERPLSSPPPPPMATSSFEGNLAGYGRYGPPSYPPPNTPDPSNSFTFGAAQATNNYLGVPMPVTQPLRLKQAVGKKDAHQGNDSSRLQPLMQPGISGVSPIQTKPNPAPPVAFVPEGSNAVRISASGKPRPVLSIRTHNLEVKKKRPPLPNPPQDAKSIQAIQKNWNEGQKLREAREQLANQSQVNAADSKPPSHVKGKESLDGSNENGTGRREQYQTHRVGPSIDSTNSSLRVAAHSNTTVEPERRIVEPPKTLYGLDQSNQVTSEADKAKAQEKKRGLGSIKSISSKIGWKRPRSRSFTAGEVQFVMENAANLSDTSLNRPQPHRSNTSSVSINSSLKSASKGLFRTGTSVFGFGKAARPQHPSSTTYTYQQPSAGGSLSSLRLGSRPNPPNMSSSSLPGQRSVQDKEISYPKEVFPPPNGLSNNTINGVSSAPPTPSQSGAQGPAPMVQSWQVYQPYSYQTYQDSTIRSNNSGRSVQSERHNDWRGAPLSTNSFDQSQRSRANSNASNSIRSGVGSNAGPVTTGFVSGFGVGVGTAGPIAVGSEANRGGKGQSFLGKLALGSSRKPKGVQRIDLFR